MMTSKVQSAACRTALPFLCLLALLLGLGMSPVRGDEGPGNWWMFHHDLQHTGRSPFTGPALPVQQWAFLTGDSIESSPAIGSDGTIYVGSEDDHLYALNPDGTLQWAFPTYYSIDSSPAIGVDGTLYVGSWDDNLYAINPDGTQQWAFPGGGSDSSPAIGSDGTIYVGSEDDHLYAINPDGTKKWSFPTIHIPSTHLRPLERTARSTSGQGMAIFMRSTRTARRNGHSPVVNDLVFSGRRDGRHHLSWVVDGNLYAINPDGTQKWAFYPGPLVRSITSIPPRPSGRTAPFMSGRWMVICMPSTRMARKSGRFPPGTMIYSSPAIGADGTIYVGSVMTNSMPSTRTARNSGRFPPDTDRFLAGHRGGRHHLYRVGGWQALCYSARRRANHTAIRHTTRYHRCRHGHQATGDGIGAGCRRPDRDRGHHAHHAIVRRQSRRRHPGWNADSECGAWRGHLPQCHPGSRRNRL